MSEVNNSNINNTSKSDLKVTMAVEEKEEGTDNKHKEKQDESRERRSRSRNKRRSTHTKSRKEGSEMHDSSSRRSFNDSSSAHLMGSMGQIFGPNNDEGTQANNNNKMDDSSKYHADRSERRPSHSKTRRDRDQEDNNRRRARRPMDDSSRPRSDKEKERIGRSSRRDRESRRDRSEKESSRRHRHTKDHRERDRDRHHSRRESRRERDRHPSPSSVSPRQSPTRSNNNNNNAISQEGLAVLLQELYNTVKRMEQTQLTQVTKIDSLESQLQQQHAILQHLSGSTPLPPPPPPPPQAIQQETTATIDNTTSQKPTQQVDSTKTISLVKKAESTEEEAPIEMTLSDAVATMNTKEEDTTAQDRTIPKSKEDDLPPPLMAPTKTEEEAEQPVESKDNKKESNLLEAKEKEEIPEAKIAANEEPTPPLATDKEPPTSPLTAASAVPVDVIKLQRDFVGLLGRAMFKHEQNIQALTMKMNAEVMRATTTSSDSVYMSSRNLAISKINLNKVKKDVSTLINAARSHHEESMTEVTKKMKSELLVPSDSDQMASMDSSSKHASAMGDIDMDRIQQELTSLISTAMKEYDDAMMEVSQKLQLGLEPEEASALDDATAAPITKEDLAKVRHELVGLMSQEMAQHDEDMQVLVQKFVDQMKAEAKKTLLQEAAAKTTVQEFTKGETSPVASRDSSPSPAARPSYHGTTTKQQPPGIASTEGPPPERPSLAATKKKPSATKRSSASSKQPPPPHSPVTADRPSLTSKLLKSPKSLSQSPLSPADKDRPGERISAAKELSKVKNKLKEKLGKMMD